MSEELLIGITTAILIVLITLVCHLLARKEGLECDVRRLERETARQEEQIADLKQMLKEEKARAAVQAKLHRAGIAECEEQIYRLEDRNLALEMGIEVTDEFQEVERQLDADAPIIFVHGGAGVGKSTLIQWLRRKKKIDVLLAPTGLAALNIGGMTIHKFFSLPPHDVFFKDEAPRRISPESEDVLEHTHVICIDEISMVRSDLLDLLDRTLRLYHKANCPFGGYQILLVGDLYQLPPVTVKKVQRFFDPTHPEFNPVHGWESPWFFHSDVIKRYGCEEIWLTQIFRQRTEKAFCNCLNSLRTYQNIGETLEFLRDRIPKTEEPESGDVILVATNTLAKQYNSQRLDVLTGEEIVYNAAGTGIFADVSSFLKEEEKVPADVKLTIKPGSFVMLLHNDPDGRYVNGSTGVVVSADDKLVQIRLKNGQFVDVGYYTWFAYEPCWNREKKCFEQKEVGTFTQMPLRIAYAITCHKAQGKTLDSIFLDVRAFSPGQMYVALSRVRAIENIKTKRDFMLSDFKIDPILCDRKKLELL